jgi:hypothetical protein
MRKMTAVLTYPCLRKYQPYQRGRVVVMDVDVIVVTVVDVDVVMGVVVVSSYKKIRHY